MIVEAALQAGALEKWRKGGGLEARVFEVAATRSITRTADGFDLRDFDEVLGERQTKAEYGVHEMSSP
jgi:hypothetical protein